MARAMKDSEIEWIGEIPDQWDTRRLKFLCTITTGNQDTQDNDPNGIYPFYVRSPIVEHSNKYTFDGDAILMAGDGVGAGKVFHYVSGKYGCHQRVYSLQNIKKINRRYLYYFLQNLFYISIETANSKSTVDSVRLDMLQNFLILLPNREEQQRIAYFLDHHCAETDKVIAETERTIEEYKALKQSIITEAVTHGIRGQRPMKDSGVEWIGEIPADWDCTILKRHCTFQTGSTPSTTNESWFNGDLEWFTPADFNDQYLLVESSRKLSQLAREDGAATIIPASSVMIIGIGGTAGKIGYTTKECSCNQQITSIQPDNTLSPKYLMYWMEANSKVLKETSLYTTLPIINNQTMGQYLLIIPKTVVEQIEITNYLDEKCADIERIIQMKEQLINELKSYRKSIIYEYVTGKKEVPIVCN